MNSRQGGRFDHERLRRRRREALDGLNVARKQATGLIEVARAKRLKNQPVILI